MKPTQFVKELQSNFAEIEGLGFVVNDELANFQVNSNVDAENLEGLVMRLYFLAIDPEKEIRFFINQYEENRFLYLIKATETVWFFALSKDNNFAKLHFFIKYLLSDLEPDFQMETEEPSSNDTVEISDSMQSAKRIQSLLMPDMNEALKIYKKGYFWYQPKDGVGGDFYWSARTKTHQWLVIGDCTGHSMEGALASVSVLSILQQVFRADMNPHHLIKEVHQGLKNIQKQDLLEGYGIGCEMIVIRTDLKDMSVKYSGTGLPLYTIEGDKITPYKTKKSSLDPDRVVKFVRSRTLKLDAGAGVFTHCDGLIDQIGSNGKRLRTVTLLDSIRKEGSVNERSIKNHFDRWRGSEVQTDDVVCMYFQP